MNNDSRSCAQIPVIIAVDVEPDPFHVHHDAREPWLGYESLHPYLGKMRTRFENATGSAVHYTWAFRMDPQVAEAYGAPEWAVRHYEHLVRDSLDHGDEAATHVHGYRWIDAKNAWLEDLGNQEWMDECVEMAVAAHRRAFGQPCGTVRFGNYWLSTASVNLCEKLGVKHELTVEPGRAPYRWEPKGEWTGEIPQVYRVPRVPYWPSRSDFRKADDSGSRSIRMIPMTAGWLQLGLSLGTRVRRLVRNGYAHRFQDTPLSMWRAWPAPNTFDRMLDRAIATQARPYLAFAIRSSSSVDGSFERVDHCLRTLLEHPMRKRFVFTTPGEAMQMLHVEA